MEHKPASYEAPSTGSPSEQQPMESAMKPLLWVLIPFIIMLVYGAMTS